MELAAVAVTRPGAFLAKRLAEAFPETEAFAPERYARQAGGVTGFNEPVARLLARLWGEKQGFLLIMASGIAVRAIAPLLADKTRDPAVVLLDAQGRFAVSLLSGHLGGANELAAEVGRRLGATPVITTATDAAGVPAVEVWAREKGFRWEPRDGVVAVNAAWANGEPVGAWVDPEVDDPTTALTPHLAFRTNDEEEARRFPGALFGISPRLKPEMPVALWLRPPCLYLGVGCRKAADPDAVETGVRKALKDAGFSSLSVAEVVSVDEKAGELGLHRLARYWEVPFRTFSAEKLAVVPVPTPSARVKEAVGTPSVSEAAALLAAEGGPLVLPKVTGGTWTLAVAQAKSSKPPSP